MLAETVQCTAARPLDLPPKFPVVGVRVSATSYAEMTRLCRQWIEQRRRWTGAGSGDSTAPPARTVAILSVNTVMEAYYDREFRSVVNAVDAATTDGMPLVWALRSSGFPGQQRVYGPDLMLWICRQAAELGHRVFLYGGRPETLDELVDRLTSRFPGLIVAGSHCPPFRPLTAEEDARVVRQILDSKADIVFVGIGTPKQERWMAAHRSSLPGVVMFGVGAAFDFHAGRVRQAPAWMQRAGLEWFFRLLMEPRRLWRRYLMNPIYMAARGFEKLGLMGNSDLPEQGLASGPGWERRPWKLTFGVGTIQLGTATFDVKRLKIPFAELMREPAPPLPPLVSLDGARASLAESYPAAERLPRVKLLPGAIRYAPFQYRRFFIDLTPGFAEYSRKWSSSTRNHLKRAVKRYQAAVGGALDLREYRTPEEMLEFARLAGDLSAKTYQEKLAKAGLPTTREFLQSTLDRAATGNVRAYLLFAREQPAAYLFCSCEDGVITTDWTGYDPAVRKLRPGVVLHYVVIERLFENREFQVLDFGKGDFGYKDLLATGHIPCADIFHFPRTARNYALVFAHDALEGGWRAVARLLDSLRLRSWLRKLLCQSVAGES